MIDETANELREQKEAFNIFDQEQKGKLNKEQAKFAYMALGWSFSDEELDSIFSKYGVEDMITFEKFSKYLQIRPKDKEIEEEIMETFTEMDKDGDGKVNAKDLKYLLYSIGEKFNDEEINEIITQTSNTKDGCIHYEDMVKIMLEK